MAVAAKKRLPEKPKNVVAAARGKSSPGRAHGAWREFLKSLIGAAVIFLTVKTFLVEAYRIPSGSMEPTLLVGDWLFVNKLVYGPHVPFTRDVSLPGYAQPKRGEVVVFVSPRQVDQPEDPTPTLVKRLMGMPGDTLFMRGGLLHVNGIPQRPGFGAASEPGSAPDGTSPLFAWQRRYALGESRFGGAPAQPTLDHWGPLVVPPRHYFMLGDSRYNSKDSRYWGIVPRENLRGRPLFVYYSFDAENSDTPIPFITDIRWGRIGHRIR